jgi:hypothetical protein
MALGTLCAFNPPQDLSCNERGVALWSAPDGEVVDSWLNYATDEFGGAPQFGNGKAGVRFAGADLAQYAGFNLTTVDFYINDLGDATITVKILSGEEGETELYSQDVPDVAGNQWNSVVLTTPVSIDASSDLWITYDIDGAAGAALPAYDNSDSVVAPGYSNLLYYYGSWHEATAPATNMMIKGLITNGSRTRELTGYEVFLDGTSKGSPEGLTFDFNSDNSLVHNQQYEAGVKAIYDNGESDMITTDFTFQFLCNAPQNLAVADSGYATWEAPESGRDFINYVLTLDGNEVGQTTDLFYDFESDDLTHAQAYEAGVKAVYDEGTSEVISSNFTYFNYTPGHISGTVTITGSEVEVTEVDLTIGETTISPAADGSYDFELIAGTYAMSASCEGFVSINLSDLVVVPEEIVTQDILFASPEAEVSTMYIEMEVGPDSLGEATLTLTNTSDIPLEWKGSLSIYDDPVTTVETSRELCDVVAEISLPASTYGVAIGDERIGCIWPGYGPPSILETYDYTGSLVYSCEIPLDVTVGMDISYDKVNNKIIAVGSDMNVYSIPFEDVTAGNIETLGTIESDISVWGTTYIPETNDIFITDLFNQRFGKFNITNGTYSELAQPPYWARSIGYMPSDPDGFTIWAEAQGVEDSGTMGFYRYNPLTNIWETEPSVELDYDTWYAAGGVEVTDKWREGYEDIAIYEQQTQKVYILEGFESSKSWLYLDENSTSGTLENNGDSQQITIKANLTSEFLGRLVSVAEGAYAGAEVTFSGTNWEGAGPVDVLISFNLNFVDNDDEVNPYEKTELKQNFPNPFNPVTSISFSLDNDYDKVNLDVFNIKGQKVKTLHNGKLNAGTHTIKFEADEFGSGVYFYKLSTGNFTECRKMILMK